MPRLREVKRELAFRRDGGRFFVLPPRIVDLFKRHEQHHDAAPEAGGIMLGRIIVDAGDVIVDDATIPSRGDRRGRFTFFRAVGAAQEAVINAWRVSGGTRIYLGDWHSHPEDSPTPSPRDLENWRSIARAARYEQDSLFFVIVGRRSMRAWEHKRGGAESLPLLLENA